MAHNCDPAAGRWERVKGQLEAGQGYTLRSCLKRKTSFHPLQEKNQTSLSSVMG